jgi:hypothetical protein
MSEIIPPDWVIDVVGLLDAMAGDGISLDGQADPADLVVDLAQYLGCPDAADLKAAIIEKMEAVQ